MIRLIDSRLALILLAMWMIPSAAPAAAPGVKGNKLVRAPGDERPDFSDVTSARRAAALVRRGWLVRTLLFPAELGGPDVPQNRVYLPPAVEYTRQLVIKAMIRSVREDLINKMEVRAEYRGKSIVPTRIVMEATHSRKPGAFIPAIEVW